MVSPLPPQHQAVLNFVAQVPQGKVTTYGDVARALWLPTPRLVGRILHHNPDADRFPCHRVVFANGALAPSYAFGGADAQRRKLAAEGVMFTKGGRVNLTQSLWRSRV